jgi:hypothetical protein
VRSFARYSKRKGHRARLELIDTATGHVIGTYATVEAAIDAHRKFQRQQPHYVPVIIREEK